MGNVFKVRCLVPFCKRYHKASFVHEWICWSHWKTVPLARRKAYIRAVNETRPSWLIKKGGQPDPKWMRPRDERRWGRARTRAELDRLWSRLKRDVIARSLGT